MQWITSQIKIEKIKIVGAVLDLPANQQNQCVPNIA